MIISPLKFSGHRKLMSDNVQFEGELYILATDQGFINQPDLVWEKFNEVRSVSLHIFTLDMSSRSICNSSSPFVLSTCCLLCLIVSNSIKFTILYCCLPRCRTCLLHVLLPLIRLNSIMHY